MAIIGLASEDVIAGICFTPARGQRGCCKALATILSNIHFVEAETL